MIAPACQLQTIVTKRFGFLANFLEGQIGPLAGE
jgi:hypothetical protein